MDRSAAFERALQFQRATLALVADELTPIDEGWVIRSSALPDVWSINAVWVRRPIEYETAIDLAGRHLNGLTYRHLIVEHEATGEGLSAEFRSRGWDVSREVVMALARYPDQISGAPVLVEADEDGALALMRRWIKEDPELEVTPEGLEQLREFARLTWRARRARRLGALDAEGALAAITMLYSDGAVAQVEDVYTVPDARGRGFAHALVTRAATLARGAGHGLVFIVADDDDWPKELYRRRGFEPVGRTWVFHRNL